MRIALIDDSYTDRSLLLKTIKASFKDSGIEILEIQEYENGDTFFQDFTFGRFDLIIIDIFMGDCLGINVAEKIRTLDEHVCITFCTSSNDFASEAYGVNACYYILKPITPDKIQSLIKRMNLSDLIKNKHVFLPDTQKILINSITYTECMDHSIFFHLCNGDTLRSRLQQRQLEHILSPFRQFFSCSRGIIVNFDYVSKKAEDSFIMHDNTIVPISRRRKKETTIAFQNYLFQCLKECE